METLVDILMERDEMDYDEACERVEEAKVNLRNYLDEGDMYGAMNICEEEFGLELDYLMELMR